MFSARGRLELTVQKVMQEVGMKMNYRICKDNLLKKKINDFAFNVSFYLS